MSGTSKNELVANCKAVLLNPVTAAVASVSVVTVPVPVVILYAAPPVPAFFTVATLIATISVPSTGYALSWL